jgi:excisionase family DNA binding protein
MRNEHTPAPRRAARAATPGTATGSRTEAANGPSEALALLSADELARRWGLRRKAIYNLVDCHGLPVVKLGRYYRFREASVDAWLADREEQI